MRIKNKFAITLTVPTKKDDTLTRYFDRLDLQKYQGLQLLMGSRFWTTLQCLLNIFIPALKCLYLPLSLYFHIIGIYGIFLCFFISSILIIKCPFSFLLLYICAFSHFFLVRIAKYLLICNSKKHILVLFIQMIFSLFLFFIFHFIVY